jgi:hypothetical protein
MLKGAVLLVGLSGTLITDAALAADECKTVVECAQAAAIVAGLARGDVDNVKKQYGALLSNLRAPAEHGNDCLNTEVCAVSCQPNEVLMTGGCLIPGEGQVELRTATALDTS